MARIVVLDPNIWISLAWKNNFSLLPDGLESVFVFASSEVAAQELARVLKRKKFAKKIPPDVAQEAVALHQGFCAFVEPSYIFADSPNPKDNYLFDICREASADYLLTLPTPKGGGFLGYPANAVVYLPSYHGLPDR